MGSWYLQNGNDSDVVFSSRIRLSRNVKGIPFTHKAKKSDLQKIYDIMKDASYTIGYGLKFIDMKDLDENTKMSLFEKRIIDKEFITNINPCTAILINDDENICIEINGENHIKIQTLCSGFDLINLMNLAIEIDKKIEEYLPYSFDEQYGYLNNTPTNLGTGMKASVLVHLPGLNLTRKIKSTTNIITAFGMNIVGAYGEGTRSEGDMYQISNNQTIGITEQDIISNLQVITQKIIDQERSTRKNLAKNEIDFEDKLYRSYGILTNARRLEYTESLNYISAVKLGIDLGIIQELDDKKIRELMLYVKPYSLQKRLGTKLNTNEQITERAKVIKQIISEQ